MTEDVKFEDGGDGPLRLKALDVDDLAVLAALAQDAVFPATEMRWDRKNRRFAILLNRFRWEKKTGSSGKDFERVQAVLAIEDVRGVQSQGVDKSDPEMVFSLLSIAFEAGEDGTGHVELTLAGDGAIKLDVEALEVVLRDVTQPYVAPSGKAPSHPA